MAQLSRPYQIALGVFVVFGLIWAVALRSHGSNPSEPKAATAPSSASANGSSGGNAAAPTKIYHGAAPGVEGLTRAIAKAHGAVAESQRNVQEQAGRAQALTGEAQASATSTHTTSAGTTTQSVAVIHKADAAPDLARRTVTSVHKTSTSAHGTSTVTHTGTTTVEKTTAAHRTVAPTDKPTVRVHSTVKHASKSAQQLAVEHELAEGKTVMLFFWTPSSSVDQQNVLQAKALVAHSKGMLTLHLALASQVGEFGTITEVVHVYQTPTILIVNKHGVVSTLTGLTDVFALEQVVQEAQSAVV
jgi:TolA-binding protein